MTFSGHRLMQAWHSRVVRVLLWAVAILMMTVPGQAMAQSYGSGGGGGFSDLGAGLLRLICDFTKSPIVTVICAAGLLVCFVMAGLNEDKGTLSKVLKVVGFCLGIVILPRLLTQIGFSWSC